MNKIKVFVDGMPLAKEHPSGIGHLLQATLAALVCDESFQQKYELVLYAPRNMYKNLHKTGIKNAQVKALPYPAARIINNLNYAHILPPVDLTLGKGIYLFGNYNNYPLTKKSRSVTWVHDLSYERFPETVSPKVRQHLHRQVPFWVRRADVVATISQFGRKEITEFYNLEPSRVALVMAGVNRELFSPQPKNVVEQVKKKYGLPEEYILFVGNIEPRKNLKLLVDAFAALPKIYKDKYSLVIIGGDGWNNEAIHTAIDTARTQGASVVLPEHYVPDEDIPAIMSGAKFLAHPALYEGFGMTPLEALACGTEVLVSDIPPLREVVGAYGDYVSATANAQELATALVCKLGTTPKSKKDIDAWLEGFSWQHAAQELLGILDSLSATM